jgi:hypothetical protein
MPSDYKITGKRTFQIRIPDATPVDGARISRERFSRKSARRLL